MVVMVAATWSLSERDDWIRSSDAVFHQLKLAHASGCFCSIHIKVLDTQERKGLT